MVPARACELRDCGLPMRGKGSLGARSSATASRSGARDPYGSQGFFCVPGPSRRQIKTSGVTLRARAGEVRGGEQTAIVSAATLNEPVASASASSSCVRHFHSLGELLCGAYVVSPRPAACEVLARSTASATATVKAPGTGFAERAQAREIRRAPLAVIASRHCVGLHRFADTAASIRPCGSL